MAALMMHDGSYGYGGTSATEWPARTYASTETQPVTAPNIVYVVYSAPPAPFAADEVAAKQAEQEPREPPTWEPLSILGEPQPGSPAPKRKMGARAPPA